VTSGRLSRLLFIGAWASSFPAVCQDNSNCSSCHDLAQKVQDGVHAAVGCAACHPKHEEYPHPSGIAKPACSQCHQRVAQADAIGIHGQQRQAGNAGAPDCAMCHGDVHEIKTTRSAEFRRHLHETCGMCHSGIADHFSASVHGQAVRKGIPDAPICTDCHGEHSILPHTHPASQVHRSHIRETCERCHGDLRLSRRFGLPADRVVSFEASFHGLAEKAGNQSVANCASCHGIHDILPSSDPRSSIYPANLPKTCGHCHPGAGQRFSLGPIHFLEGGKEPPGIRWARNIYLLIIPLTIGLMALHNLGDWVRKVYRLRLRAAAVSVHDASGNPGWFREVRMFRFERLQHALLLVSFVVLAWTGFALKYPDQWWSRPLLLWEDKFPVRATVHRVAAAVMIGVALMHLISLIANRRLREHWKELLPRVADVGEAWRNFAWLLGIRAQKPKVSPHGYIEKAEYWAVVWGTVIMAMTGVMLWAVRYTLAWFPKSWLDFATAVHFYEAVLATLAIVVWHLYSVIFDPDVYPMDTAWLTGLSPRKRESQEPEQQPGAAD
jgi:cytochrome b subunit of formate dehydrogenase